MFQFQTCKYLQILKFHQNYSNFQHGATDINEVEPYTEHSNPKSSPELSVSDLSIPQMHHFPAQVFVFPAATPW